MSSSKAAVISAGRPERSRGCGGTTPSRARFEKSARGAAAVHRDVPAADHDDVAVQFQLNAFGLLRFDVQKEVEAFQSTPWP